MHVPGHSPPAFPPGSTCLIGAGPGDRGLLTWHAAHPMTTADVVLNDGLVPQAIRALAAQARLELGGTRAGGLRTEGAAEDAVALISHATHPDQNVRLETAGAAVPAIPPDAATLLIVGPGLAPRPLLADLRKTSPMTIAADANVPPVRATG